MGAEGLLYFWHLLRRGLAGIRRVTVVGPGSGATSCHRTYLFFFELLSGGLFPPVIVVRGSNKVKPFCTVLDRVCYKGVKVLYCVDRLEAGGGQLQLDPDILEEFLHETDFVFSLQGGRNIRVKGRAKVTVASPEIPTNVFKKVTKA